MIGLIVLFAFVTARLVAFVWALPRLVSERFAIGIAAILAAECVFAVVSLAPQTATLVVWPTAYAGAVVALDVVPLVVAWRREHAAAQGSDDEARAERIVRDVLPLALLDAARLICRVPRRVDGGGSRRARREPRTEVRGSSGFELKARFAGSPRSGASATPRHVLTGRGGENATHAGRGPTLPWRSSGRQAAGKERVRSGRCSFSAL